ncbi:hypothetical protein CH254_20540 [Rhodococcus sp. 06-412-2C]|uniref:hypothetical protein n=1 Tax=unclassified Rhodococcus (in: high G+C Gram-positive bacteria) TaxID=192944 RepID=UPI000B9C2560|nr:MULTISPECIES: hypothetical protein [unclassified Rhodococcus (in: high G+C Gram-positive bacteria)]OZC84783.1 hypothetical protein CH254_20540 [Rhodococcus sp. 06-412-2C]OZC98436.1 hypothetical protein CH279_13185 [Rhodococcus sp. 06-412-2B]
MTLSLEAPDHSTQLHNSIHLMRRVMPGVGFGVRAAELGDHAVATWVRTSGVTVLAHDDDELDRVQLSGIRPNQIVFRCGAGTDGIRNAVHRGVFRFVVGTEPQIARLTECAQRTKYVYLDSDAAAVLCGHRVQAVGLHSDVDNSGDPDEWASAAQRLLRRAFESATCGSPVHRIILSGGSTEAWMNCSVPYQTSVVRAVDAALRDGCTRWNLPRPAVSVIPAQAAR